MDDQRKNAYRYLLYWGIVEVRALRWTPPHGRRALSPLHWQHEHRRQRGVAAITSWLQNLALYSCNDFDGFDEEALWKDYAVITAKYPHAGAADYRELFEQRLQQQNGRGE